MSRLSSANLKEEGIAPSRGRYALAHSKSIGVPGF